mmetsp:Transcript_9986/g.20210  ORF Transcript_9986/g.20210 Transcript_9986/m.20210 type:complete len:257 (-) Transcript_9986:43-813(-)
MVTIPSSLNFSRMLGSMKNVPMIGMGFASPVVSITMWSIFRFVVPKPEPEAGAKAGSNAREATTSSGTRASNIFTRSCLTVQQMQPLFSKNTSSPSTFSFVSTSSWSMPISPYSFSITATRRLWSSVSTRLSSVVLPLPRKPVTTVTGTRGSSKGTASASASPVARHGAAAAARWLGRSGPRLPLPPTAALLRATLLATRLSPFGRRGERAAFTNEDTRPPAARTAPLVAARDNADPFTTTMLASLSLALPLLRRT